MSDSYKKSLVKTISWRVVATCTTMVLVWIFTGKLDLSLKVGILEVFLKMLFYYIHERLWSKKEL
ncbi:DUF2061 domain-containing protein [Candidatus Nomurabacteria bacterium]|nr:DUF2061 domain-containing protein [Candidatus Nomurabacteria bacterium]